ncbi:GNAT family N-acetyltransferase [Aerococcus sanguinicola]|uniref:GNAT family N-acetyltransferase n=1 Tax=unclassified Aerococcus TaxID=2618060 RepID=UPI0008A2C5ED|nr:MULTISPECIES: GNAT family N-acetyltransferase [unclassified Aerococcus]KAB0646621.1 GNAT family N-acetyltransferase [Aerococcus sanguinicola]MDK6233962.1 GNAT family N-acetyltransferase [Aerococcus sp. UMB10185]MDK6856481.1 GNAT family N-acetyltransferase [Aerococcus sp. UMB7533]MDK8502707.1 GNAT family N-acetyltransferase [Aerococcus sp. UMB1112A]OFN04030.1 hypothetical protein HMPREF2626_04575 [Aerococcus sp. HMSC062A02]
MLAIYRPGDQAPESLLEAMEGVDFPGGGYLAEKLEDQTLQAGEMVLVVTDVSGGLMAFASLLEEDIVPDLDYGPFLAAVYVDPNYRGQGIFYHLVSLIELEAKSQGQSQLYVISQHKNLYSKVGYQFKEDLVDFMERPVYCFNKAL